MTIHDWVNLLEQKCSVALPGSSAHLQMAPYRQLPSQEKLTEQRNAFRQAAVAVLLYPANDTCCFSLIQRPNYVGVHGGQISFPGGKLEENESFQAAALRELEEEVGINKGEVNIIGELTEVFIPPSRMRVIPYLCYVPHTPTFIIDAHEVEEVFSVEINDILRPENIKSTRLTIAKGTRQEQELEVPYFDLNNKVVWGATAVILSELRALLQEE
jgi:8-oxo-dGTP pyrophosphatase MutT (NUDIX family)